MRCSIKQPTRIFAAAVALGLLAYIAIIGLMKNDVRTIFKTIYGFPDTDRAIQMYTMEKEETPQDDSEIHFSKIKDRFDAMHDHVVNVCFKHSNYSTIKSIQPWRSLAFGRLSFCAIAKVGTRFLQGVLRPTLKKIGDYPFPKENRKRFVLVREPYSRLVSAFFSKLLGHPNWWHVSKTLISIYRQNASDANSTCGHDLTFPELVKAVVDENRHPYTNDPHLARIMEVCNVCADTPDFIGKLEHVKEDMTYILHSVNVTGLTNSTYNEVNETAWGFMRFKDWNKDCGPVCPILKRYWWGQQVNGHISSQIDLPVERDQCDNLTANQMQALTWTAHMQTQNLKSAGLFNKKEAKRKALADLYSQVPIEDRLKLKRLFSIECELFGYDPDPDFVFPKL